MGNLVFENVNVANIVMEITNTKDEVVNIVNLVPVQMVEKDRISNLL